MIVLGAYVALIKYTGDGPFWSDQGIEPDCDKDWWSNLLYVNNLTHRKVFPYLLQMLKMQSQYGAFENVNYRPTFSKSLKTVNGMFRSKLTLLTNLVNNDTSVYITPNFLLGPCRRAGLRGFE